jgi:hypothetical protein
VEQLPSDILKGLRRTKTAQGDVVTLPTASFVSDYVLKYVRDPAVRRAMYVETYKEDCEVCVCARACRPLGGMVIGNDRLAMSSCPSRQHCERAWPCRTFCSELVVYTIHSIPVKAHWQLSPLQAR